MNKNNLKNAQVKNENNPYNQELFEERFRIIIAEYKEKIKEAQAKLKKYNSEAASLENDVNNTKRAFCKCTHEDITFIVDRLSKWLLRDKGDLSVAYGFIEIYEKYIKLYKEYLNRLESAQISIDEQNVYNEELAHKTFSNWILELELDLVDIKGELHKYELDYESYTIEINRLNGYKDSADVSLSVRDWLFDKVLALELDRAEIAGGIKTQNLKVEIYKKQIQHYKNWG